MSDHPADHQMSGADTGNMNPHPQEGMPSAQLFSEIQANPARFDEILNGFAQSHRISQIERQQLRDQVAILQNQLSSLGNIHSRESLRGTPSDSRSTETVSGNHVSSGNNFERDRSFGNNGHSSRGPNPEGANERNPSSPRSVQGQPNYGNPDGYTCRNNSVPRLPVSRSEKLPDPKMYDGRSSARCQEFLNALHLKIQGNADRFPSEEAKIVYAITRLEGPAQQFMMTFFGKDAVRSLGNIDEFYNELNLRFGDTFRCDNARRKLRTCKQHQHSFAEHVSYFQTLANDAQIHDDCSLKDFLYESLNATTFEDTKHLEFDSLTFNQMVKKFLDTIHRTQRGREIHGGSKQRADVYRPAPVPVLATNYRSSSNSTNIRSDPRPSTFVTKTTKVATPANGSYDHYGPAPMHLDKDRRGPITPEEKNRRRQKNLCLYCAGSDHWNQDCPARKQRPARNVELGPLAISSDSDHPDLDKPEVEESEKE